MRAARFHGAGDLRVEEVPAPGDLTGDEVLIRLQACGICGTDLHEYRKGPILIPRSPHALTGASLPQILGHECAGVIAAVGPEVRSLEVGRRVVVMPGIFCGECAQCRNGEEELCSRGACFGISYRWGGLAEFAVVAEEGAIPIPDQMSFEAAALIEPTAAAVHAVTSAGIGVGDLVLVTGGGAIGQLVGLAVRAAGAQPLISEPAPGRRDRAGRLGFEVNDPGAEPIAETLARLKMRAVDACVECSGSAAGLKACLETVERGGVVVQTGLFAEPIEVDLDLLVFRGIDLRGRVGWPIRDWPKVIDLIAAGTIPATEVISSAVDLAQLTDVGLPRLLDPAGDELKLVVTI